MTHPTRSALDNAIANAERGHRPSEWEGAAALLAVCAREYILHVEEKRAEWERVINPVPLPGSLMTMGDPDPTTSHGRYIIQELLPEWARLFVAKSNDYGETANHLGAAGQYADMHRKMGKLKRALWDGATLDGEQPREILMDLIGHAFLTIHYIDKGDNGR
jgi:hypothetical protein